VLLLLVMVLVMGCEQQLGWEMGSAQRQQGWVMGWVLLLVRVRQLGLAAYCCRS
jgi:hypothetical protein